VGTVANICVLHAAGSAALRGFKVVVPKDGVSALTDFDLFAAFRQITFLYRGLALPSSSGHPFRLGSPFPRKLLSFFRPRENAAGGDKVRPSSGKIGHENLTDFDRGFYTKPPNDLHDSGIKRLGMGRSVRTETSG
jgi:hypothetical protein